MQKLLQVFAAIIAETANYLPHTPNAASNFVSRIAEIIDDPETQGAIVDAGFSHEDQSQLTKSNEFFGERVYVAELMFHVDQAIEALNALDKIKKGLFYPNRQYLNTFASEFKCETVPHMIDPQNEQTGRDLLHAILGVATEAGEQLELLRDVLDGKPFDAVGFFEETGDGRWYNAIGAKAAGFSLRNCDKNNIRKLIEKRYKKATFTGAEANIRDLGAERGFLEEMQKAAIATTHPPEGFHFTESSTEVLAQNGGAEMIGQRRDDETGRQHG